MRLDPDRYLEHVADDGERLVEAAAAHLDAPVPWCPGWVGRDVISHTGVVHRHKTAIVADRLLENPDPDEAPVDDPALLAWYREGLAGMLAALGDTDSAAAVWTWHSPEQTVGFWVRRMAHETAIHRADAESTAGPITPLDPTLAADGVDEVLGPIMAAYTTDPAWEFAPDGSTVEVRLPDVGEVRHLVMGSGKHGPGWLYEEGPAAGPAAVIEAPASALDLWAWGRADEAVLSIDGDAAPVRTIRAVVASVTGGG